MKRTDRFFLRRLVLFAAMTLLGAAGCGSSPGAWFPSLENDGGSEATPGAAGVCATPLVEPCDACTSDSDCGTILGVTNSACNVATGVCETIVCTSDRDCPALEVCNTWYGYCVDRSDTIGCTNMKCSGDTPCPCSGSVCGSFDGQCS